MRAQTGTISHLQGGKFGHGFASAAGSAATAPLVDASSANVVRGAVVKTLVGGTLSRISGGNFANGALTAAMSYAFNHLATGSQTAAADKDGDGIIDFDDVWGREALPPARSVYSASDGVVELVGWESEIKQKQGFGFRIRIRAEDGSAFVYAHMDPERNYLSLRSAVRAGQWLGVYADPPNGTATGPHLHFEWRAANGRPLDPTSFKDIVMPNSRVTSGMSLNRMHPVLRRIRSHNGIDFVERR